MMTGEGGAVSHLEAKLCNRVQTRAKAHRFVTLRRASSWQPEDIHRAHVLPGSGTRAGVRGRLGALASWAACLQMLTFTQKTSRSRRLSVRRRRAIRNRDVLLPHPAPAVGGRAALDNVGGHGIVRTRPAAKSPVPNGAGYQNRESNR
jgi:hypothetical protein